MTNFVSGFGEGIKFIMDFKNTEVDMGRYCGIAEFIFKMRDLKNGNNFFKSFLVYRFDKTYLYNFGCFRKPEGVKGMVCIRQRGCKKSEIVVVDVSILKDEVSFFVKMDLPSYDETPEYEENNTHPLQGSLSRKFKFLVSPVVDTSIKLFKYASYGALIGYTMSCAASQVLVEKIINYF